MQAIVLARRDIKENDQIVSFYTLEKGKVELLARGVKKITSKNSAHLEPFSFVDVEVTEGKEINYLTKVHPINYFISIRKNLEKSLAAGFLVSTLNKLLHEGENDERIFNLTIGWLEYLSLESSVCRLQLLDAFFVKFLSLLGFDITEMKNVVGTAKEDLMFFKGCQRHNCVQRMKRANCGLF